MNIDSIYFKGHLCFKEKWAGFDTIKQINVIIGRNNSGKSHLLDLVEALCDGIHNSQDWQYRCISILDEETLRSMFREGARGDPLRGDHWHDHGRHFIDKPITWEANTKAREVDINAQEPDKNKWEFGINKGIVFPDDSQLDSPYGESSTNARCELIRHAERNSPV